MSQGDLAATKTSSDCKTAPKTLPAGDSKHLLLHRCASSNPSRRIPESDGITGDSTGASDPSRGIAIGGRSR